MALQKRIIITGSPCTGIQPENHSGKNASAADSPCTTWAFTVAGTERPQCTARTGYFHKGSQARTKLELLVTQLAEKETIDEQMKAQDQLAWVRAMGNIHNRAEEIINEELIFA